ncbi:MAG: hypothetical protein M3159_07670 [Actinomycetota bacterium]|nr:hypothetical protein [Actinomycetota bacterium]
MPAERVGPAGPGADPAGHGASSWSPPGLAPLSAWSSAIVGSMSSSANKSPMAAMRANSLRASAA